jgi:ribosome-binding factor A
MLELEKLVSKKVPVRQLRVAESIKTAIAEAIVQRKVDAEVLESNFITISKVKVSPDLHNATVFITAFQTENSKNLIKDLNNLAPKFRFIVTKFLKLKTSPQIYFRYDDTAEQVDKINSLLDSIKDEE